MDKRLEEIEVALEDAVPDFPREDVIFLLSLIKAKDEALKRYGSHEFFCELNSGASRACSCGLKKALSGGEEK